MGTGEAVWVIPVTEWNVGREMRSVLGIERREGKSGVELGAY